MGVLQKGDSCKQSDLQNVPVTKSDPSKAGSYDISGDGVAINKQIGADVTQTTDVAKNPVTVTNTGKPELDVAGCS